MTVDWHLVSLWTIVNSALPLTALASEGRAAQRWLVAASAVASLLAGALIGWFSESLDGQMWIVVLGWAAAFLPTSVMVLAGRIARGHRWAFGFLASLVLFAAAPGAGALALHGFVRAIDAIPLAWIPAPEKMRGPIAEGLKAAAEDCFEVSAVRGVIGEAGEPKNPAAELALWIFSQRMGATLQPGRPLAGVMKGNFVADPASVKIVAIPDERGRVHCRMVARGRIDYRLRLLPSAGEADPANDKVWNDEEYFVLEGLFQPADQSVTLEIVEVVSQARP